jgi:hypothetical protein
VLWPEPQSMTVWIGEDWSTATVMAVASGRWGIAVCREVVPRGAVPLELLERARSEDDARARSYELVARTLGEGMSERVALVAR